MSTLNKTILITGLIILFIGTGCSTQNQKQIERSSRPEASESSSDNQGEKQKNDSNKLESLSLERYYRDMSKIKKLIKENRRRRMDWLDYKRRQKELRIPFKDRPPRKITEALSPIPAMDIIAHSKESPSPSDDPVNLASAKIKKFHDYYILFTFHSEHPNLFSILRIYQYHTDGTCSPLTELQHTYGNDEIKIMRHKTGKIILNHHQQGGSSSFHYYDAWWFGTKVENDSEGFPIRKLEIEDPLSLQDQVLDENQWVSEGRVSIAPYSGGPTLRFHFSIWNEDDKSNFPSGGGVKGRLKLKTDKIGYPVSYEIADWRKIEPND